MKKLVIALTLVGAMIMGFASMAAAEVTVGGSVDIRYDLWKNINLNTGASEFQSVNFFDERVMVNVDAKVTQGLEGFVEFDTDNQNWGRQTSPGDIPSYLNNEPSLEYAGAGNARLGTIAIRQAWINAMVPGIPVGVKIGHQPLALGHGIWLDTSRYGSDAILAYAKPMPALLVAGAYVQMGQNGPTNPANNGAFNRIGAGLGTNNLKDTLNTDKVHSGAHAYAALANYTWMPNNTVGINVTYVRDHSSLDGALSSILGNIGNGHRIWATNVGIPVDGTIGMVNYKGEFDWLYTNTKNIFGQGLSYTESGFAGMLGANVNLMKMANVGMEAAYGTGNSAQDPQIFYNPGGAAPGGSKHMDHAYYTPYDSTSYNYAFLYNDKIGQGPLGSGGGFGFGDGYGGFGLANTGYIKVSASVTPTDRLKAGLDFLYLRASEAAIAGQSRDLGWELDGNVGYKLYDNLSLDLTGGVFDPGAWYSYKGHGAVANTAILTDPTDGTSPIKRNVAWGMETKLSMKF